MGIRKYNLHSVSLKFSEKLYKINKNGGPSLPIFFVSHSLSPSQLLALCLSISFLILHNSFCVSLFGGPKCCARENVKGIKERRGEGEETQGIGGGEGGRIWVDLSCKGVKEIVGAQEG